MKRWEHFCLFKIEVAISAFFLSYYLFRSDMSKCLNLFFKNGTSKFTDIRLCNLAVKRNCRKKYLLQLYTDPDDCLNLLAH